MSVDSEIDFQSVLMGDVLFRASATVGITLTVSGPTSYTWTETIAAGSWFSSPLALAQYMVNAWNGATAGSSMAVTLVSDPTDTNYRKLAFVPDTGLGTITAFSITVGEVYADLGFSAATTALGSGTSTKYSGVCPYVLVPYWPMAKYERGLDNLTGASAMAHDGSTYSSGGSFQRTVNLSLALDRTDMTETTAWMKLWRDRLTRGRAITLFMQRSNLPTTWTVDINAIAEVLELRNEGENLDFTRMIEYRQLIDYSRDLALVHRMPRLDDAEAYNGSVYTAPTRRVTHFYRATAGETIFSTASAVLDPEDVLVLFWFRVVSGVGYGTPGDVVNDGLTYAFYASVPDDYPAQSVEGCLSLFDGGDGSDFRFKQGRWALCALMSNGSELTFKIKDAVTGAIRDSGQEGSIQFGDIGPDLVFGDGSGSIVLDIANVGVFSGRHSISDAEFDALTLAGVKHDYAVETGSWSSEEPLYYWCGAPVSGEVQSVSSAVDVLEWSSTPSYGTL